MSAAAGENTVDPWLWSRATELAARYPRVTAEEVYRHVFLGRPFKAIEVACDIVNRNPGPLELKLDVLLDATAPLASAANGLCLHQRRVRVRCLPTSPEVHRWSVVCRTCGAVWTDRKGWSPPLAEQEPVTYPGAALEILAYEVIP